MNDIALLSSFHATGDFPSLLLHDTLNFSTAACTGVALHSWRWHFFLGTLPLVADDAATHITDCHTACQSWGVYWSEAEHRLQQTPRSSTAAAEAEKPPRAVKFGETSSDEDEKATTLPSLGVPLTSTSTPLQSSSSAELLLENPLDPSKDSSYALRFQVEKTRRDIAKDMNRLHWKTSVFEDPATKDVISDILLKYCLTEKQEYKQGFHELVAFLYCTCACDAAAVHSWTLEDSSLTGCSLYPLCKEVYTNVPAAVLALFRRLLHTDGLGLQQWYYNQDAKEQRNILMACERVQHGLLTRLDPNLQHLLNAEYDIHSATYLLRWLRLLLIREFALPDMPVVWDVIFSEVAILHLQQKPYVIEDSVILFISVKMLQHVSSQLAVNSSEAYRVLMKYPPVDQIKELLCAAIALDPDSPLSPYVVRPPQHSMNYTVHDPAVVQRQGQALSRIIPLLMGPALLTSDATATEKSEAEERFIIAIAELKKVRDVLLYGVGE